MEIKRNARECPRGALPNTTKTNKQKQPKSQKPSTTIKSDGNLRELVGGAPGKAVPKTAKSTSANKNHQNYQNHQKPPNLMETRGSGGRERIELCLLVLSGTERIDLEGN